MESRWVASGRPGHSLCGLAGSGAAHELCHEPSRAREIELRPSNASRESTPGSLEYGRTSSTRCPATLLRPTAGWPLRTSPSPTLSKTDMSLERLVTLPGQNSVASFVTRSNGEEAN